MPQKFTTFEEYCEAIATTNEWGDHSSLQILAEIYRVKFQVLSTLRGGSKFELIQPIPEDPFLDTIFLAHFGEYHYQSIKPIIGVVEEEDNHANQVKPNHIGEKRPNAFTSKTKSTKRKKKTKKPATRCIISSHSFRVSNYFESNGPHISFTTEKGLEKICFEFQHETKAIEAIKKVYSFTLFFSRIKYINLNIQIYEYTANRTSDRTSDLRNRWQTRLPI